QTLGTMRSVLLIVHAIVVMVVAGLCVWELWHAIELYGTEYRALTYERTVTAILCGAYAVGHIVLLIKKRVTTQALILYYPLSLAVGLIASLAARGYGKGWAPAETGEALRMTIMAFSIVGLLSLAAIFSCYRAFVSSRKHDAQPGAPGDAQTA